MSTLSRAIETFRDKWQQWFPKNWIRVQIHELTVQQKAINAVVLVLLGALLIWTVYCAATGRDPLPFLSKAKYILPPKMDSQSQTYDMVINFIKTDDTDKIQYVSGFNCWDATFKTMRNAVWKGIVSYPIVIQYYDAPGHMILAFPTKDRGTIFIEPQNDSQVNLQVGQYYNERKVRGFYALDYTPLPLADSPQYDININPE